MSNKTDLELFIISKIFSNEEKLDNLIENLEFFLLNANETEDEEGIFYYSKLVNEAKEKKEELNRMFGWNNAI